MPFSLTLFAAHPPPPPPPTTTPFLATTDGCAVCSPAQHLLRLLVKHFKQCGCSASPISPPTPTPLSPFPRFFCWPSPAKRHIVKFNFATCLTTTANERNIRIRTRSRTPSRILILIRIAIRLLLVSALTLTLSRHVAAPRRNLSNEFRVISQNCTS